MISYSWLLLIISCWLLLNFLIVSHYYIWNLYYFLFSHLLSVEGTPDSYKCLAISLSLQCWVDTRPVDSADWCACNNWIWVNSNCWLVMAVKSCSCCWNLLGAWNIGAFGRILSQNGAFWNLSSHWFWLLFWEYAFLLVMFIRPL